MELTKLLLGLSIIHGAGATSCALEMKTAERGFGNTEIDRGVLYISSHYCQLDDFSLPESNLGLFYVPADISKVWCGTFHNLWSEVNSTLVVAPMGPAGSWVMASSMTYRDCHLAPIHLGLVSPSSRMYSKTDAQKRRIKNIIDICFSSCAYRWAGPDNSADPPVAYPYIFTPFHGIYPVNEIGGKSIAASGYGGFNPSLMLFAVLKWEQLEIDLNGAHCDMDCQPEGASSTCTALNHNPNFDPVNPGIYPCTSSQYNAGGVAACLSCLPLKKEFFFTLMESETLISAYIYLNPAKALDMIFPRSQNNDYTIIPTPSWTDSGTSVASISLPTETVGFWKDLAGCTDNECPVVFCGDYEVENYRDIYRGTLSHFVQEQYVIEIGGAGGETVSCGPPFISGYITGKNTTETGEDIQGDAMALSLRYDGTSNLWDFPNIVGNFEELSGPGCPHTFHAMFEGSGRRGASDADLNDWITTVCPSCTNKCASLSNCDTTEVCGENHGYNSLKGRYVFDDSSKTSQKWQYHESTMLMPSEFDVFLHFYVVDYLAMRQQHFQFTPFNDWDNTNGPFLKSASQTITPANTQLFNIDVEEQLIVLVKLRSRNDMASGDAQYDIKGLNMNPSVSLGCDDDDPINEEMQLDCTGGGFDPASLCSVSERLVQLTQCCSKQVSARTTNGCKEGYQQVFQLMKNLCAGSGQCPDDIISGMLCTRIENDLHSRCSAMETVSYYYNEGENTCDWYTAKYMPELCYQNYQNTWSGDTYIPYLSNPYFANSFGYLGGVGGYGFSGMNYGGSSNYYYYGYGYGSYRRLAEIPTGLNPRRQMYWAASLIISQLFKNVLLFRQPDALDRRALVDADIFSNGPKYRTVTDGGSVTTAGQFLHGSVLTSTSPDRMLTSRWEFGEVSNLDIHDQKVLGEHVEDYLVAVRDNFRFSLPFTNGAGDPVKFLNRVAVGVNELTQEDGDIEAMSTFVSSWLRMQWETVVGDLQGQDNQHYMPMLPTCDANFEESLTRDAISLGVATNSDSSCSPPTDTQAVREIIRDIRHHITETSPIFENM